MLRLFYLGLPKEGTNTLTRALRDAGLEVAHGYGPDRYHVGALLERAYSERRDPMRYLPGVEACTHPAICVPRKGLNHWPQMNLGLLRSLLKRHPKCVFVGSTRPVRNVVGSIQNWRDMQERYVNADIPGLPVGVGGTAQELARWVRWHRQRMRAFFRGNRYCEINVEDGASCRATLSRIGIRVPCWPHENANCL